MAAAQRAQPRERSPHAGGRGSPERKHTHLLLTHIQVERLPLKLHFGHLIPAGTGAGGGDGDVLLEAAQPHWHSSPPHRTELRAEAQPALPVRGHSPLDEVHSLVSLQDNKPKRGEGQECCIARYVLQENSRVSECPAAPRVGTGQRAAAGIPALLLTPRHPVHAPAPQPHVLPQHEARRVISLTSIPSIHK